MNILKIREELSANKDLQRHVNNLLKNTEYKGIKLEKLSAEAINKAITFAKMNLTVAKETGIPLTYLYDETLHRRKMDSELINLVNYFS